jgi:CXXC-20-CXXC protein
MANPRCPACGKDIEWKHSLSFWNPWDFACPHCRTRLEASRIQKNIAMAVIPGGVLLAAAFLFLQRQLGFSRVALIVILIMIVASLMVGARVSWRRTSFTPRGGS